jgi:lysosomal acid lipase/cholesteryl ester hydrolase
MGNNRGCAYSLGHIKYDPFDKDDAPLYWNFSFEEMGLYDLPAEIDFILDYTG